MGSASASPASVLPARCAQISYGAFLFLPSNNGNRSSLGYWLTPSKRTWTKFSCSNLSRFVTVRCSLTYHGFGDDPSKQSQPQERGNKSFWEECKENSTEMRAKLAKLGLAAVLAYGLFDALTYTTFFVLAFIGYEKRTGNNPAANIRALIGIVILMWTGNNVTRPFRVAGAAALAPVIDQSLKRIKKALNFPNVAYAFALVVGIVASTCFTVIGLLILSRWGK